MSKNSKDEKRYTIYKCISCQTVQVYPIPDQKELDQYYSAEYFSKRTDRGYDDYYSDSMRKELFRVWELNLKDLNTWDRIEERNGRSLDIGCAAGFFVDFLKSKSWDAQGIEIAREPIQYGRNTLGLKIHEGDFLMWDRGGQEKFDLITLWASIEHMRDPLAMLNKMKTHLNPNGRVVISTCRYGLIANFRKAQWRFLNVPEHLFYFGWNNFLNIMKGIGFKKVGSVSYGSGFTTLKDASIIYRISKSIFDPLVKWTNQGDMMAFSFSLEYEKEYP
ncbi:MAG: class I SAM-dependent methyltransferase [Leptospira sp.]|nr:class I SAM-dependent methyltransferase [Leptospira sp.]